MFSQRTSPHLGTNFRGDRCWILGLFSLLIISDKKPLNNFSRKIFFREHKTLAPEKISPERKTRRKLARPLKRKEKHFFFACSCVIKNKEPTLLFLCWLENDSEDYGIDFNRSYQLLEADSELRSLEGFRIAWTIWWTR